MDDPLYEWVRWCEPLASSSRPPPVTSVVLRRGRPRRRRRVVVGLRGRGARDGRGRGPGAARGPLEGKLRSWVPSQSRSAERRVGKVGGGLCRVRWSQVYEKK